MKRFFENISYRIRVFMQGRYGTDELSYFLLTAALVLLLLSCFIRQLSILYLFSLALLIWSWFRSLSRNIYKRQNERSKYLEIKTKIKQKPVLIKNMWRDRKTHRYYKCPHCKVFTRISNPGKGRNITITCPKCHNRFDKRT